MEMDNKTIAKVLGGLAALMLFSRVQSISSDTSQAAAEARKANDGIAALRLELALDGVTSSPAAAAKATDDHGSSSSGSSHATTTKAGAKASGATGGDEKPHWTYTGSTGAASWGTLDPAYATCSKGVAQSPIDLGQTKKADLPDLDMSYKAVAGTVVDNGHTIQVDVKPGSKVKIDGTEFELAQFHFHGPAEHTVGGRTFPLELHLVHKTPAGKLAVIGVLVTTGEENPAFTPVLSNLPSAENVGKAIGDIDPAKMLPSLRATYRYTGSLTTPPCTEGVAWNVMAQPISMSKAQLDMLTKAFHEPNNRPVQPLGSRDVLLDATASAG
jgi:carbonic anhydrase